MLPDQTLNAVVSAREINLAKIARPAVLIFHGQDTAKAAIEVNNAVRTAFPDADKVLVASIIDLRQFPAMFHGMVKPELEKAYHKAAGNLAPEQTAADLIILLPDWKGQTHDACAVSDSTKEAAVLIADASGKVVARQQGGDLGAVAVAALQDQ